MMDKARVHALILLLNYLSLVLLTCIFYSCKAQALNLLAFEYNRKFQEIPNLSLDIGECAHYVEEISPGIPLVKQCMLPPVHGQQLVPTRSYRLNDTQNIQVKSPGDIFTYIGLCDASAVFTLGLLHRGECIAIEIANNLSFNKKTYIRAYIEYYRHKVDILELQNDFTALLTAGHGKELFVKNRSIGTMEIVLLEAKFHNKRMAALLKKTRYHSLSMRDWFSHIKAVSGEPANTKIIRLSTANNLMETKKFKVGQSAEIDGLLGRYEAEILDTRTEIERGFREPHLNYAFQPYFARGPRLRVGSDRVLWERASLVEIDINLAMLRHRSLNRKCKRQFLPACKLMKKVKKNIRRLKRTLDSKRRNWITLKHLRKHQIVETTRKEINSLLQEQTKMNAQFRQWRRQEKIRKRAERRKGGSRGKKQGRRKKKKTKVRTNEAVNITAVPLFNNTILSSV